MRRVDASLLVAALLALGGCGPDADQALSQTPVEPAVVLATVDGTSVTRAQLELAIERTLGESAPLFANADVERKILDSLVSGRAMARLAERDLSPAEREELELRTQAYREELLVRDYLKKHATAQPVTTEMVAQYYQRHPDEFGGGVEKRFEIITANGALNEQMRDQLIRQLSDPKLAAADWRSRVESWRATGTPVEFRSGQARVELLEQPLRGLVESTPAGKVAPLSTRDGLTLVRVTEEKRLPARPLAEVSGDIREKLAPLQLKQAVKQLGATALNSVKVEYSSQ